MSSPKERFYGAFKPLTSVPDPPGPTPPLPSPVRLVLVPTPQHSTTTTARPHDLRDLPLTTLLELRINHSTTHISVHMSASTSFSCLTSHAFHVSNLFDLLLILPHLSTAQIACIRALKIRWYTAVCVLWEGGNVEHASRVASVALETLSGLEKVVVECEGRENWRVEAMKGKLSGCLDGLGVEIEMVGGREEGIWGGTLWGWGNLGG
ncbi:hypothetical protein DE146DRAFT_761530 [Phaeosphaeria sp. MPI-PUGE-AT-0046c]|nr:hypothetical protein DE146DRAFT_761530 [Phaeosphaeria sp. MPI-PUGE-AT-0046c]